MKLRPAILTMLCLETCLFQWCNYDCYVLQHLIQKNYFNITISFIHNLSFYYFTTLKFNEMAVISKVSELD